MTPASPTNEYQKRSETLEGRVVGIESYKVGQRFSARVDNVDPGAVIGRGQGATREEAEQMALASAALTLQLRDVSEAMRRSVDVLPAKRRGNE